MMASRGMGDMNPSKMPGRKTIHRKDKPQDVEMYKKGGMAKKMSKGGELKEPPEDNKGLQNLPEEVRNKMGYLKKGGDVWDKPRPKSLGKPKKLSPEKKSAAKAAAKKAGRPYPNLIDNMRMAK